MMQTPYAVNLAFLLCESEDDLKKKTEQILKDSNMIDYECDNYLLTDLHSYQYDEGFELVIPKKSFPYGGLKMDNGLIIPDLCIAIKRGIFSNSHQQRPSHEVVQDISKFRNKVNSLARKYKFASITNQMGIELI